MENKLVRDFKNVITLSFTFLLQMAILYGINQRFNVDAGNKNTAGNTDLSAVL